MSSTWRNKETKKSNNITHKSGSPITSPPENFKNIPMFEVLKPVVPSNDPSVASPSSEKTVEGFDSVEGFDMMGDDYFKKCIRYIRLKGFSGISEYFQKTINMTFTNPVEKLDKSIEDTIFSILYAMLLMTDKGCEEETVLEKQSKDKAFAGFWWARGNIGDVWRQSFTTMSDADVTEGFTLDTAPEIRKTVYSFKQNHPEFISNADIYEKVAEYYVSQLNERETKIKRRMTDNELFQFNNYIDNQLNLPDVQSKILKLKPKSIQTTQTTFKNTMADYNKYYKSIARFKISNTTPIDYFTFNDSDEKKYFDLSDNAALPPNTSSGKEDDRDYAYTIDFNTMKKVPIQTYLDDVITHYASIFIRAKRNEPYRIYELKSRIGTVYVNLLNYLEFQFYRMYGTFFNKNHLALFNHIFYVLLKQTPLITLADGTIVPSENVYNSDKTISPYLYFGTQTMKTIYKFLFEKILSVDDSKLKFLYLLESIPTDEIATPDKPYSYMIPENRYLYSYMLLPSTEMNPTDGLSLYPDSLFNTDNKNVLMDYILLPEPPFEIEPEMKNYYTEELSECEKQQLSKKNKFKKYAKFIKEELYKILLVPVSIYVAYNFYYLFFFKDCADPAKKYNEETGDTTYENTCENCTSPVFPDVESYYHYYEEHRSDFLFELAFKPAKFIYTSLNTIKALFRKEFGLYNSTVPKDEFPYIFLFACFAYFYTYFLNNYQYILSIFKHIIGLDFEKMNAIVIDKQNILPSFAYGITMMFFIETVFRRFFGISLKAIFNNIGAKINPLSIINTMKDVASNATDSWIFWIGSSTPFVGIFKFIYALFYWFIKGYIVFALIPFYVTIVILYFIYNLFFGIYNNSSADISMFDKIELITRIIYTKLYNVQESNDFMYLVKSIFWFLFFYLYEFIAILVLITGLMNLLKNIDSAEINTVITMFYLFFIIGIILWSMYKYKIIKPKLDNEYMRDENSKQFSFDILNCKDKYEQNSGNSMFNIFIASDAYNKDIIDEYMEKKNKEALEQKPSGLQKSLMSMVNLVGDKMQSAQSFLQEKSGDVTATLSSGMNETKDLLKSKLNDTKSVFWNPLASATGLDKATASAGISAQNMLSNFNLFGKTSGNLPEAAAAGLSNLNQSNNINPMNIQSNFDELSKSPESIMGKINPDILNKFSPKTQERIEKFANSDTVKKGLKTFNNLFGKKAE